MKTQIAVVTGANRGLGLATAESLLKSGYKVILASKSELNLATQLDFCNRKYNFVWESLDVANQKSIEKFAEKVLAEQSRVDILINNAGVFIDRKSALTTDLSEFQKTLSINTVGPMLLIQQILPSMIQNNYGRIVNVSSQLGSLSEMGPGNAAYRISKTALNAVTRIFSGEVGTKNILINSVSPGWVKTDMGGEGAPRSIEKGIEGIIWAATLSDDGPRGGFFCDAKPIAW